MDENTKEAFEAYLFVRAVERTGLHRGVLLGIAGTLVASRVVRLVNVDELKPWAKSRKKN
jgi:hypothetical protein